MCSKSKKFSLLPNNRENVELSGVINIDKVNIIAEGLKEITDAMSSK